MNNSAYEDEPCFSSVELALPGGPLTTHDIEEISDIYTSKLGGFPVLVDNIEIPKCGKCQVPMYFILQMDCPLPEIDRILYIFGCNTAKCSSSPEAWYSFFYYLPKDEKKTEQAQPIEKKNFWNMDFDTTEKALSSLQISDPLPKFTTFNFQEYPHQFPCTFLRICEEFWNEPSYSKRNEGKAIISPELTSPVEEEADVYEKIMPIGVDKEFEYFQKRVSAYPRQCVRYFPGGKPLPFSNQPVPSPSSCPICHSPRIFDLQLMPAIFHYLPVSNEKYLAHIPKHLRNQHPLFGDEMHWGTVFISSCHSGCHLLGKSTSTALCHIQQENE
jgi:hypothetical protein